MLRNTTPADARARRPAFTLVELMVVVAIIVVLAALVLGAIAGLVSNAQQAATEDVFRTVDTKLRQHWNYVVTQAKKETPSTGVYILAGKYTTSGQSMNTSLADERARVIHVKLRLMQAFPESFAEINNPPFFGVPLGSTTYDLLVDSQGRRDMTNTATYQKAIKNYNTANHKPATESSACLILALSIARGSQDSVLKPDSLPANIVDFDQDGLKDIVDTWGTPIRFKRFAGTVSGSTAIAVELDSLCPSPKVSTLKNASGAYVYFDPNNKTNPLKLNDPLDLQGTLGQNGWYTSPLTVPMRQKVESILGFAYTGRYTVPYLQSAGPNQQLDDSDDLYSFRLRVGGHGD